MKNILFIKSSPKGSESFSQRAAETLVRDLRQRHPEAKLVIRDLVNNPPPHIGEDFVRLRGAQADQLSGKEAEVMSLSDSFIEELFVADVIVIAAPMHNFTIPSTLKAWIDHVARPGRTFSYSSNGPVGLLKEKQAILVLARGGVYTEGPSKALEFQESYLRAVLGFIGITDVHTVHVEGINMKSIGSEKALATAEQQGKDIIAQLT